MHDEPSTNNLERLSPDEETKPFVIELERLDMTTDGHFRPAASVKITPALRTSGLLAAMAPEDLKNLLFILTFIHPNGFCQATVQDLSHWMQASERKVRARMQRLAAFRWQGQPLIREINRESGLDTFTPAREILAVVERPATPIEAQQPVIQAAGREAVVAHSRQQYARQRKDVEREIALLNGWDVPDAFATPEEKARAEVRQNLVMLGVPKAQADDLLSRFALEQIQRQLEWLPYRNANSPSRFIVAAIEGDYEAPAALKHRHIEQLSDLAAQPSSTMPPEVEAAHEDSDAAPAHSAPADEPPSAA